MKLSIFVPLTVFLSFSTAELTGANEVDNAASIPDCVRERCLPEANSVAACDQVDHDCCAEPDMTVFHDTLSKCLTLTGCSPDPEGKIITVSTEEFG
ncbi:hypothetical protein N7492_004505 [Penicillium capsulatum]|uniref:Extracellular membrane protein CFEM domain-containing protein n=1 Tax=Penicillium capsulatum TaxID=69766 RepID=A0A9W9LQA2_9EURO|nr:hypothetical protein N7492_004505 [Penicillium capsulatum]KAJ6136374.1 hypothetical protein N7512_001534 [Penicillium capsulatum]